MPDGVLLIDKPKDLTSMAVTRKIKRLLGADKAGHLGTLDPMATGLLPVMVGRATRLAPYIDHHDKTYRGRMRLGIVTDTYDAEGRVVQEHDPVPEGILRTGISLPEVSRVAAGFIGEIEQVPPMYSAIKKNGRPLYRLARLGEVVERESRKVVIKDFQILGMEDFELVFEVTCSPGTYVRSLAHDLGRALRYGAHLSELRRTRHGRFRVEDALTLEGLTGEAAIAGMISLRNCLPEWPELMVNEDQAQRIRDGKAIAVAELNDMQIQAGELFRMIHDGELIGLYKSEERETGVFLKALRVFC